MEARALKSREYRTDIVSHPDHNVVNYDAKTRYTNTNRSNVFHSEPDPRYTQALENKRDSHFREVPLKTKATRASYQDSNIFNNKDAERGTIQASCVSPDQNVKMRASNTFASSVFGDATNTAPA